MTSYLNGMTVLQLGRGTAGAWAGATFRDLGATVHVFASPKDVLGSDKAGTSTILEDLLGAGKTPVTSDDLSEALRLNPDVVICDRVEGPASGLPSTVAEHISQVAELNSQVWVTIAAFGLSGPDAEEFASDFTLSASAGVLDYVRRASGEPMALPGCQALLAAGQGAVLAGIHAVDRRRSIGEPVHVEVSAQEAMIATGPVLYVADYLLDLASGGLSRRFGAPYGWFQCSDGMIYLCVGEDHQWAGVVKVIDAPAWAGALGKREDRWDRKAEIDELVQAWTSVRSKSECETLLQAGGVPAGAMNSIREVRDSAQFSYRKQWDPIHIRDKDISVMKSQYPDTIPVRTPHHDSHRDAPGLSGLRVLEASHVLAASVAGSILGAMGASVTKIEAADRMDIYRRTGPFIDGHEDLDWSGYFAMANHSKQSRLLDEATDVEDLIREADVVVENWGKSRASRYGLDCASVGRTNPDALALSCSGFGHTGPLSHYRVYAYNLNAYCGLTDTMRGDSEAPPPLEFAWADFVSAFVLATVIAAWAVGSDGQPRQGSQVDLSMAEVIVQRLNLFVALSAMDLAPAATGLGDEGFRDLLIAVPGQESKVAVSLRDAADQETLDAILRGDQAHTTQGSLVRSLRQAGIFAGPLWGVREVSESDHLADRGFFAHITHQKWGKRRLIGLPWRFVGSGAIELGPPPVLRDPVGHSDTGTATDPDTERA